MCNNSPAESTSPENGWRWSVAPSCLTPVGYFEPGRPRVVGGRGGPHDDIVAVQSVAWAQMKRPLVRILVVVAYSREDLEDWSGEGFRVNSSWTRVSRSWGKGKTPLFAWKGCPSRLGVGSSLPSRGGGTRPRKGIGLTFPNRSVEAASAVGGNANKLGDVGGSPGKSCLFFLTERVPWNRVGRR